MTEPDICPIIIISGPDGEAIAESFIKKDAIKVGRGEENDICLQDRSMEMSREHIELIKKGGDIYLYDLNSRNGTLVNGKKIAGKPFGHRLTPEDEVILGEYKLRLYSSLASTGEIRIDAHKFASADTLEHAIADPFDQLTVSTVVRRKKLSALVIDDQDLQKERSMAAPLMLVLLLLTLGAAWHFDWSKYLLDILSPPPPQRSTPSRPVKPVTPIPAIAVKTLTIPLRPVEEKVVLQGSGYVAVKRQATIKAQVEKKIEEICVRVGQKVRQEQVLARLDQSDARVTLNLSYTQLKIARMESEEIAGKLREAERELQRYQRLYGKGLVSKQDLEKKQSQQDHLLAQWQRYRQNIETSEYQIKKVKLQMENTLVRAPFTGVIIEKLCELGEVASPQGNPLFTLIDRNGIGATIDLNERYISKIFVEQKVRLVLNAYPSRIYLGKVRKILPSADKQKGAIPVDVVFIAPDDVVLPNMSVKATFLSEKAQAKVPYRILLPSQAVKRQRNRYYVWVMTPSRQAQPQDVVIGASSGDQVEITHGLDGGSRVIVASRGKLTPGAAVAPAD